MRASYSSSAIIEMRQAKRLLGTAVAITVVLGLRWVSSLEGFVSYVMITAAALLPAALWLRARAPGIPVLPAVAAFHYLYFAVPILRQNLGGRYTPNDILRAGITVTLFLVLATVTWGLIVGRSRPSRMPQPAQEIRSGGTLIMFGGLAIGTVFQVAAATGSVEAFGTYFGVVRAVCTTAGLIAAYLLGHFRARGLLRGQPWGIAIGGLAVNVAISWSTLFLVAGMQLVMAAALGYVITAKRIPWRAFLPFFAVLFILHAGKGEMRDRYWPGGVAASTTVFDMPGRFVEWTEDGIANLTSGDEQPDIIDRASLLFMLLHVQQVTPEYIPYLDGATYALLPQYLIPRFLAPDKSVSQAGMALLNIRYGILTREGVATTAIGWGVIAEAFANFGYLGVAGAAVVFGFLTAFFTRWSTGQPPLSLPMLLSVAALVTLANLEADFGYLLSNLWQALVATLLFLLPIKYFAATAQISTQIRPIRADNAPAE